MLVLRYRKPLPMFPSRSPALDFQLRRPTAVCPPARYQVPATGRAARWVLRNFFFFFFFFFFDWSENCQSQVSSFTSTCGLFNIHSHLWLLAGNLVSFVFVLTVSLLLCARVFRHQWVGSPTCWASWSAPVCQYHRVPCCAQVNPVYFCEDLIEIQLFFLLKWEELAWVRQSST